MICCWLRLIPNQLLLFGVKKNVGAVKAIPTLDKAIAANAILIQKIYEKNCTRAYTVLLKKLVCTYISAPIHLVTEGFFCVNFQSKLKKLGKM